jgi:hypothetical protein
LRVEKTKFTLPLKKGHTPHPKVSNIILIITQAFNVSLLIFYKSPIFISGITEHNVLEFSLPNPFIFVS